MRNLLNNKTIKNRLFFPYIIVFILFLCIFSSAVINKSYVYSEAYTRVDSTAVITESMNNSKKYAYYLAMVPCLKNASINDTNTLKAYRMSRSNAASGTWVASSSREAIQFQTGTNDQWELVRGISYCNSDGIDPGLTALGYSSESDRFMLLCNMNFKRTEGEGTCSSVAGDSSFEEIDKSTSINVDKFKTQIKNKFPDMFASPGTSDLGNAKKDAREYQLYKTIFKNGCIGDIDPETAEDKASSPFKILVLGKSNKVENYDYYSSDEGQNGSSSISFFPSDNGTQVNKTCDELQKTVNDLAIHYWGIINKNIEEDPTLTTDEERQKAKDESEESATSAETTTDDVKSSCSVEGVGWIICPVVRFLSKVADYAYGFIAENFLKIDKSLLSNSNAAGGTKDAWNKVVSIANIAFVIAFLVIIFSQLTSLGINNYGIKKMLPKLIVAIILVNLSFYICQIAVDISNIVGSSVSKFIGDTMSQNINASAGDESAASTGTGFAGIAGIALAGTAAGVALWASLTALIPVVISAIVAAVMILFILAARKALVVILVVISPLAFVAYLLPNTEGLFKKWKKAFISLLMVYPIIAFVFAGSKLVSGILKGSLAGTVSGGVGDTTEKSDPYNIGQIIASGIQVLPLFIVPGILKKSLDGIGSIGAKINGIGGKLGKGASGKYSNSKFNKNWEQGRATKKALIEGGQYNGGKYNPNTWRSKAHGAFNKSGFSRRYGNVVAATGAATAAKQNKEDVDMASSQLDDLNLNSDDIQKIAMGEENSRGYGNIAMQQAAIKKMVESNDIDGMNKLWDSINDKKDKPDTREAKLIRQSFAQSLLSSKDRPAWFGAGAIDGMLNRTQSEVEYEDEVTHEKRKRMEYDQQSSTESMVSAMTSGAYSPDKIAHADKKEIDKLIKATLPDSGLGLNTTVIDRLRNNAREALSKESTNMVIGKNREKINELAGFPVTRTGATATDGRTGTTSDGGTFTTASGDGTGTTSSGGSGTDTTSSGDGGTFTTSL